MRIIETGASGLGLPTVLDHAGMSRAALPTRDDEWDRFLMDNAGVGYHPVGTCKMGVSEDAVVDPELRVKGVRGLRVADASVMPTLVTANTNAPAMMIGEKAADLIRNERSARR